MTFKILFATLIIIVRLLIGVRVFSWVILNFFTNVPHPISEIESYLVLMILDIWFSSQPSEITIKKIED
jgi:hypothetical protein